MSKANFDTESYYLQKLNVMDVKEQSEIKIANRFVALENSSEVWTSLGLG
jgi:hypothetical protein